MSEKKVTIVGAGLVGSLLSVFLAKRGYDVEMFERRPDIRVDDSDGGRSINLVVTLRGIHALKEVGLGEGVLEQTIPLKGRMMHAVDRKLTYQPYGDDSSQFIYAISRVGLNKFLLTAAEKTGKVKINFNQNAKEVNFDKKVISFRDEATGMRRDQSYTRVFGTDGSASAFRRAMLELDGYEATEDPLAHGYKELVIPSGKAGSFQMEKNYLHIWPRGQYMFIALPNFDGSFTCTLFLPFKSSEACPWSFEKLENPEMVTAFFKEQFPDALELIPDIETSFFENPTGKLVTVKSQPWNVGDNVLMLGDAAHAVVPFFGQGMNCGFEDCTILNRFLDETNEDWAKSLEKMSKERKQDADAIADMALENFIEMRDKVGDSKFLLQKKVEQVLQEKFPQKYISRYSTVMFTRKPYSYAFARGKIQQEILNELCSELDRVEDLDLERAERLIQDKLFS